MTEAKTAGYNVKGLLDHVGFTSSIAAADRPELTKKLGRLIEPPGFMETLLAGQAVGVAGKKMLGSHSNLSLWLKCALTT